MRKVIDNFLDKPDFERLQQALLETDTGFPWFYSKVVTPGSDMECSEIDNWQLCHPFYDIPKDKDFYRNNFYRTPTMDLILPILQKLEPKILIRVKANLNSRTHDIITHAYHTDVPADELAAVGKTAVFYVNTNNGYTIFEDGERVESVANRIVMFDATQKHSGTTCTDQQFRCVININWL